MTRDEIARYVDSTLAIEAESVARLRTDLDLGAVAKCVEVLTACRGKIITTGCGTSAAAAKKIAHSLNCIDRPALFVTPSDAVHGGLGVVQSSDVVIVISKGGNTLEIASMLPAIKTKKAYLIGVTENGTSVLGTQADLCLRVMVAAEPDEFNMLATASTLAVIATFDAICVALMRCTNYTREQFAVIHPGGAVGERLTNRKQ